MNIFLLFSSVLSTLIPSAAFAYKIRTCYYGGYSFVGTQYSDSYNPKQEWNIDTCINANLVAKSKEINDGFNANKILVRNAATEVLNNSSCAGIKNVVLQYLDNKKVLEDLIAEDSKNIHETNKYILEEMPGFEIQANSAIGGLYNAACANENHRKISMFNLEIINQLMVQHPEPQPASITHAHPHADDCTNVTASGEDDLSEFTVSMKNGTQNFIFTFNPFSVADQVIIKNQNNKILYDSGCRANNDLDTSTISLTLDAPQDSKLKISVNSNCQRAHSNASVWNFTLKCQTPTIDNCATQSARLVSQLKAEVELLKNIISHYDLEVQCYQSYEKEVVDRLTKFSLVAMGSSPGEVMNMMGEKSVLDLQAAQKNMRLQKIDMENAKKQINTSIGKPNGNSHGHNPNLLSSQFSSGTMSKSSLAVNHSAIKNLNEKDKSQLLALKNASSLGLSNSPNETSLHNMNSALDIAQGLAAMGLPSILNPDILPMNNPISNQEAENIHPREDKPPQEKIAESTVRQLGKHSSISEKDLELRQSCDCEADDETSIFERISWSYSNVGFKRLGL